MRSTIWMKWLEQVICSQSQNFLTKTRARRFLFKKIFNITENSWDSTYSRRWLLWCPTAKWHKESPNNKQTADSVFSRFLLKWKKCRFNTTAVRVNQIKWVSFKRPVFCTKFFFFVFLSLHDCSTRKKSDFIVKRH